MKKMMYAVIVLTIIVAAFVIIDGSYMPKKYNRIYDEKYLNSLDTDVERIIAYAIGASSGHNMQPWLVKVIDDNEVELYADMKKELPVIDSNHNQLLMSQGTFIQKFIEGAEEYGYTATVDYADVDLDSQQPMIAKIKIEKASDVSIDTISSGTLAAMDTNTGDDIIKTIHNVISDYGNMTHEYIDTGDELTKLKYMLLLGTIAESEDYEATEELLSVFRWSEYQKNEHRYGLSLNSMPNLIKPFIQPIMMVTSKNIESFGKSSISMFEDRLKRDIGYILIKCESPNSIDYIKAGEFYQRIIAECSGYSIKPAVQLIEEYDAMDKLNKEFQSNYGDGAEVVLILTVQLQEGSASVSNPRHLVEDIIIE